MRPVLTQARLREVLHYEPMTGVFTWLQRRSRMVVIGGLAGYVRKDGYRTIKIDGRLYKAHRLAFLYMTGEWPATPKVDHFRGDRDDNRWDKLRPATNSENAQNVRRARKDNRSQLMGVSPHCNGFQARISLEGKRRFLGSFPTPELAHAAYLMAKIKYHPTSALAMDCNAALHEEYYG